MDDAIEASIQASCPRCGTVKVPIEQVRLTTETAHPGNWRSVVVFHCPTCGDLHEQHVDERSGRLLTTAGVILEVPVMLPFPEP